jgi:uncharacterized protein (TIGR02284 family)
MKQRTCLRSSWHDGCSPHGLKAMQSIQRSFEVLEGGYNGRVIRLLEKLLVIEIDAVHVYKRVLKKVQDERVVRQLVYHLMEHEQHVEALAEAIRGVGGETPRCTQSLKGWLIEGFVALRSETGTEGALTAIKGNEDLAYKYYTRVLAKRELPPRVRHLVLDLRDDLRRHADYMVGALRSMGPELE